MISGIWRRGRLSRLSLSHIGLHTTALCSRISTIGRTGTRAVKLDTIRMDLRNISFHAALVIIITSTNLAFHIYTGTFTYPFSTKGTKSRRTTILCHSVRSGTTVPFANVYPRSEVASGKLATAAPLSNSERQDLCLRCRSI